MLTDVASARGPGPQDLAVAQLEQLVRDTGDNWDRRCDRVTVLAEAVPALTRGWRARCPRDADALLLRAWSELPVDPRAATVAFQLAASAARSARLPEPGHWRR